MAPMSLPDFDPVARPYRWMEYFSFGPLLERCRFFHLPALAECREALVLGDGDGRFLARLLAANPRLRAHAVDGSPAMLHLLLKRAAQLGAGHRVTTNCADLRAFTPPGGPFDLVVTHFFLDCLEEGELQSLICRLRPQLPPGALWLVSEFQIPEGKLSATIARGVIAGLYTAFRLLTGLRIRQIPAWPEQFSHAGFIRQASRTWLRGLLVSELWRLGEATAPAIRQSHQVMPTACELDLKSPVFPNNLPGIDPGPLPSPTPTPEPEPVPAPGPEPEPDPIPYPGPAPTPQPLT